jgi:putative peptidoglycan lipid II flippase
VTAEPAETPTSPRGGGLIRSSMIFSGLTLVSRIFGLARDLVVAARLGASATAAADAFQTALAFPNLFRRIFAEGAFAAAFVPAYSKSLETDGEEVADKLAGDAMATLAAATIVITVICELAMPWLMYVINAGYADDPIKFKLAVTLTQISMPYLPCMAIVAHLSGVLNARGRFVLSAIAPVVLNLCMLGAMWPQKDPRMAAIAGSIGVIVAGVLQAALLAWGVRKSGAEVRWVLPTLTPEIRELLGRAVPGAISASATQLNIFISGYLASFVNGGRTWLATADRLYQLPLGLVGVAIGVALLPQLSRAVQAKDHSEAQTAMDQAITFAMALTLPAAAAMASIPFFLSDALYTRGAFTVYDAHNTASALFFYGLGVPAFVLQQLYSRAFFARGDTRSPMRFALISIAVNIGAGVVFFHFFGIRGIAAATALASWINVAQSAWKLHRMDQYRPSAATWSRLGRIVAASLGMAALLATASFFRPEIQAAVGRKEVAIILVAIAGAAVYPLLLFAFGGMTLTEIKAMVRRPKADLPPPGETG